jgi:hypothetical protein
MKIFLEHIFMIKKIRKKVSLKIYEGQDPEPDPDVFESRIRILSKIVRIHNTTSKFIEVIHCMPQDAGKRRREFFSVTIVKHFSRKASITTLRKF